MNQLPLLLRKLNLIPYPVQLAEINTERKVQQQEQKLHADIVPIGTQHPFGKSICTHIIVCRKDLSERSNAFRQQFLFQKNPRNKGKRQGKHRTDNPQPIERLLYCADCGRRMTLQTHYSKKDGSIQYSYRCGGYASRVNSCTSHTISADTVEALILSAVKRFSKFVLNDEKAFALELQSLWKDKQEEKPKYNQSEFCLIDGSFLFRQVFKQS